MWRLEVLGVGDVVTGLFAKVLVWGDVDPHGGGLGARYAGGGAIAIVPRRCLCAWGDGSRMPMRVK
jgi:hypothetical protein